MSSPSIPMDVCLEGKGKEELRAVSAILKRCLFVKDVNFIEFTRIPVVRFQTVDYPSLGIKGNIKFDMTAQSSNRVTGGGISQVQYIYKTVHTATSHHLLPGTYPPRFLAQVDKNKEFIVFVKVSFSSHLNA